MRLIPLKVRWLFEDVWQDILGYWDNLRVDPAFSRRQLRNQILHAVSGFVIAVFASTLPLPAFYRWYIGIATVLAIACFKEWVEAWSDFHQLDSIIDLSVWTLATIAGLLLLI